MNMSQQINEFIEILSAERGASRNTLEAYARDLRDFFQKMTKPLADFNRDDIMLYLSHLQERGFAEKSRARKLSAIKQFLQFAFEAEYINHNPARNIPTPRAIKTLPYTLTIEETEKLLKTARYHGRTSYERARNRALTELLYATGLRVSELVSLPIAQIKSLPDTIVVRGKGNKERLVILNQDCKTALTDYLPLRAEKLEKSNSESSFLFPSRGKSGHLTRVNFFLLIKEIAIEAGLNPDHISPHVLRHAFATHLLAGGADLRVIQTLLGHADIATTEIYTHILDEQLSKLVFEHHPLAEQDKD